MKFPYELSELRLSLLSKEDRELYEYEHSDYFSYEEKMEAYNLIHGIRNDNYTDYLRQINESEDFADMELDEAEELASALEQDEYDECVEYALDFIREDLEEAYGDNWQEAKENVRKFLKELDNNTPLNEATDGPDLTWWIPGFKNIKALLGVGIAGLIGLLAAGKDKLAAKRLERYMNKMVEEIDDGVNKKKSFMSYFGNIGKKLSRNRGDQSVACFRAIQELYQREQLKQVLISAKNIGIFGDDVIKDAEAQNYTGGLFVSTPGSFKKNVSNKFDKFVRTQN